MNRAKQDLCPFQVEDISNVNHGQIVSRAEAASELVEDAGKCVLEAFKCNEGFGSVIPLSSR